MIAEIGPETLLIVGAIVLFMFGGKKLPDFARSLGRSKNEFQKGLQESADEANGTPNDAS